MKRKSPRKGAPKKRTETTTTTKSRELLDALQTTSYAEWTKSITALRSHLDRRAPAEITELDLLMILRPYLWWRHNPGFTDVYATCEAAMPVILAHLAKLGDKGKQTGKFLAEFLDTGKHDGHSDEIEISVAAETWASKLKGAEATAMRALSKLMRDIYDHKHVAYWVLRHVACQQVDSLGSLIHGLPPADQAFLLHSLDASLDKPGVPRFYKKFIADTPYPQLVPVARRYAGLDEV